MLLGFSLQFWQTVVFWLWFVAAATGAVAVAASFGSSVISYYISDETQRVSDREIAKAGATASVANEKGEAAKADAAQANLRANALEKEAAEARERYTRLQADNLKLQIELSTIIQKTNNIEIGLSPRILSKEQVKKLSEALRSSGISEINFTIIADPEARAFGMNILSALQATDIKINLRQAGAIMPPVYGIVAYGKSVLSIVRAFETAGIRLNDISESEIIPNVTVGLKDPNL